MLIFFIAVLMPILFMHVQNFPKFDDFIKNGTDTSLPVSMIVNTCSIFGSVVGFGRPYSCVSPWFLRLVISKQTLHRLSRLGRQVFVYRFGISRQLGGHVRVCTPFDRVG